MQNKEKMIEFKKKAEELKKRMIEERGTMGTRDSNKGDSNRGAREESDTDTDS